VTTRISRDDLFAGAIFIGIGAFFCIESLNYDLGSPLRMGPGFLPLALGVLLSTLGLAVAIAGLRNPRDATGDPPSWRAIILILGAIGLFGFTIRGIGFVPGVFTVAFLSAFASRLTNWFGAAVIATGLTVLSTLVFIIGLRLQVPMIGPWLRF